MKARQPANKTTIRLVGWVLSLGLSAFFLAGSAAYWLPFEPYRLGGYSIVPTVACPGQPVDLSYHSEIVKQPFATLEVGDPEQQGDEAFRTEAQWVNEDTGKRLEVETYRGDFNGKYGERDRISMFQRFAPNEPGHWRQDITIYATGTQLFQRVTQIVPTFSTEPVRVRAFEDAACR